MAIELQQLRQLIALAEHRSFVRAAAVLHMSQPALSRSIQNIERRFGSELFARTSAGVTPTDLGRLYIERSRDLLRMAEDLERDVAHHGALRTGRVTVGGGPFTSESLLGRAAARFAEHFPGVSVQVHARNWDELLRQLRSRELDFFVAETSTLHREPDLELVRMGSSHAGYFVARAGHPLAGRRGIQAADVFAWPFVAPGRIPPRVLDPLLAVQRSASPRGQLPRAFPAIECSALAPLKRILANSDAISASILSCVSTELESGTFALLGTEPWLHLEYGVVSLKDRPATQAAEKFREFVMEAEVEACAEEERLVERFAPR
ncbi:MAG: LysR family transcriptional regulator [Gammaproteobacteria bacterium]|jgi:DNA-binding transcriptional LysR family regulator|nr:LysR family transcriptional regulator [Gammaproteobacteria bacterium]